MKKKILIRRKAQEKKMTKTEAENIQLEFYEVKKQKELLAERENELKAKISEYMGSNLTPDAKGHTIMHTLNSKGEPVILQRQRRVKATLDEEKAKQILVGKLKREDLIVKNVIIAPEVTTEQVVEVLEKHCPQYLDNEEKVDENLLNQEVTNGNISMDDFQDMIEMKETFAMSFLTEEQIKKYGDTNGN